MPNGDTHDKINWLLLPPFAYMSWDFSNDLAILIIFSTSYLFSSFMFSGDLDLVSKQSKRWGLIRWIWIPYRKMFSHRSKYTHGIVWGTVIRVIYLMFLCSLTYFLIYFITLKFFPNLTNPLLAEKNFLTKVLLGQPKIYFVYLFLGLLSGAFAHTMADEFFSTTKKIFKKKKRHAKKSKRK